ncbi:ACP S-malonyltransferase [Paenibacillus monticola]|uniref:[acyl-carrier-protein] S-malonyltransferase n=1 Tax=Paenibacillus monticola TaxID=2666075 RepID=A0A7X2H2G3_9BACL|nr:ACP S-malonyltransferase [Paenibacillus monticola]MRN52280.1 ACP S-malonyltransferase [Paenibacillus monticola]
MKNFAYLMPGQGSQYVGMGKSLCRKYSAANAIFKEANEVLGFDLQALCFEGNPEELTKTENTQPAILTVSVAMFKAFMEEYGIQPAYFAGHSLGEITALTCAGAIEFHDAVKIVRNRGIFMQEASPLGVGAMGAVSGVDTNTILKMCLEACINGEIVEVANYNSPDQIVISGHKSAVERVSGKLTAKGATVIPLKVSAPFHSSLMRPAADRMREELGKYTFGPLSSEVVSGVTALPYGGADDIVDYLSEGIIRPVQWIATMNYLKSRGVSQAIEAGPGHVLKKLAKKCTSSMLVYSVDKAEDEALLNERIQASPSIEGKENGKTSFLSRCLGIAVCTQNFCWDQQAYQEGVIEPYRKVQRLVEQLNEEGKEAETEQIIEGYQMLKSVFQTKGTPVKEQISRFEQLFRETGVSSSVVDLLELPTV